MSSKVMETNACVYVCACGWERSLAHQCPSLSQQTVHSSVALCTNKHIVGTIFSKQLWNILDPVNPDSKSSNNLKTPEVKKLISVFVYLNFFSPVQPLLLFFIRPPSGCFLPFHSPVSSFIWKQIDKLASEQCYGDPDNLPFRLVQPWIGAMA